MNRIIFKNNRKSFTALGDWSYLSSQQLTPKTMELGLWGLVVGCGMSVHPALPHLRDGAVKQIHMWDFWLLCLSPEKTEILINPCCHYLFSCCIYNKTPGIYSKARYSFACFNAVPTVVCEPWRSPALPHGLRLLSLTELLEKDFFRKWDPGGPWGRPWWLLVSELLLALPIRLVLVEPVKSWTRLWIAAGRSFAVSCWEGCLRGAGRRCPGGRRRTITCAQAMVGLGEDNFILI